ncbi:hypothetical protein B7463_g11805, partial [Scytalidium lignicola]
MESDLRWPTVNEDGSLNWSFTHEDGSLDWDFTDEDDSLNLDFTDEEDQYRANGQSRRTNRAYVDHDVFEGLPVRHWRREPVTVAPPPEPPANENEKHDIWADELPHGMPKDYHLLPKHSQELLKAARSLKVSKRPAPETSNPKEVFSARAWKQIPRHLEGPCEEFLAKRRKGLITITSKQANSSSGTTWNKATVRRTDAAGNMYVQDVVFAEGEQVEGEVIAQSVIQDAAGVGAGTTPLSAAKSAPPRRRHPPPKRKAKGPGRGRKKKLVPTSAPQGTLPNGDVVGNSEEGAAEAGDVKSDTQAGETPLKDEDTEMADDSVMASDNEDGGDEEGDGPEDGEEGDESVSPVVEKASVEAQDHAPPVPAISTDMDMTGTGVPSPSPGLAGQVGSTEAKAGSPLKTVESATSPAAKDETSPENTALKVEASPPQDINEAAPSEPIADVAGSPNQPALASSGSDAAPVADQQSPKVESEDQEVMLLDTVANSTDPTILKPEADVPVSKSDAPAVEQSEPEKVEQVEQIEETEEQDQTTGEDDFPDLLSGLEKKLEGDAEAVAKASDTATSAPTEDSTKEA